MYVKTETVAVTTDGSGDSTDYTSVLNGRLYAIVYTKTDFANGVTFAITGETTGQGIWSEAAVNASTTRAPHQVATKADGTNFVYNVGVNVAAPIVVNERIKIVTSLGGATNTGTFRFMVA